MTLTKLNRRYLTIAILGLLLLIVLGLAPTYNRIQSGSTWSKAPDGYGAWYEYMQSQGAPIERWQRSLEELTTQKSAENASQPATVLRIAPPSLSGFNYLPYELNDWVKQGNRVIALSRQSPATAAPFQSELPSSSGSVTVVTRRRINDDNNVNETEITPLLFDQYGAVVWQEDTEVIDAEGNVSIGTGDFIQSTTPFLGANAYLNNPGNFAFLAELAQQGGGPIFVDEYLHGYKDTDVVVKEVAGTWFGYLEKTPLLVATIQSVVVLIVGLVAQNRRLGLAQSLESPEPNNSEAYITALAGVLHKANSQDFLIETLAKAEQKVLQKALGLGNVLVPLSTLKTAWEQTTGQSPAELNILQAKPRSDAAIQLWIRRIQQLHITASQNKQSNRTF
ncbi:MAG: DUF4350 domain-containing protein [Phormidesmis sp.]